MLGTPEEHKYGYKEKTEEILSDSIVPTTGKAVLKVVSSFPYFCHKYSEKRLHWRPLQNQMKHEYVERHAFFAEMQFTTNLKPS